MRLIAVVLTAALGLTAAAQPLEPPPRQAKLNELRSVLDYGLWNGRIDALYDLGDLGRDGLPLLAYAGGDADWQVRLTSVHFLGKAGLPAAQTLGAVAKSEPCPHVRLLALLWLQRMGATGEALFRKAATPEDEAELARLPQRYAPGVMGKPLAIDVPDEMNAEFFNGGADLRVCASSEHAGRIRVHRGRSSKEAAASHEKVVTPDVPLAARKDLPPSKRAALAAKGAPKPVPGELEASARAAAAARAALTPKQRRRAEELDKLLASGRAETLRSVAPSARFETPETRAVASVSVTERTPPSGTPESFPPSPSGAPAPPARAAAPASPRFETPDARALASASVPPSAPPPPSRAPESFPPSPPGFDVRTPEPAAIEFAPDAGTGKPENDPIPVLIGQLSASEPRKRARAADELGKRGAAALRAVPALRLALGDGDRRVRASAALALGSCAGSVDGVVPDLKRALRDKDEDVRFSAGIALERIKRPH
jgi:HEAT repeat protein